MKNLHIKFPEGLLQRIDAQRRRDRLSPGRSEFIRRLVDLQLSKLEAIDARELTRRQSQLVQHLIEVRPTEQSANNSTEQSVNSSMAQLGNGTTGAEGN